MSYLRAHRRWAYATGTALFIGTGAAGAALAAGNHGPSPTRAHSVEHTLDDHRAVHLPDWRQELNAETVQCFRATKDGPPQLIVRTKASEFPIEEVLTRERLVEECASGTDAARQVGGFDSDGASTCVSRSAVRVAAVVLGGGCGDLTKMTDHDLRRLNELPERAPSGRGGDARRPLRDGMPHPRGGDRVGATAVDRGERRGLGVGHG